ncbi:phospholipase D family protein [Dinoroseobacter sp. S124A]|uniref:phospholipase D family protein n=1 Tax=Dinoroseobacter sp. S124A TaxID=3415128 RepID=UPI003C7E6247
MPPSPEANPAPFQVLITAAQAWPAFEQAILSAEREILMGFRIFDLATKLRSDAARAIGEDWFDLLAHKLGQGVRIRLVVSDFDPVMGEELHHLSMSTLRQGAALREVAGPAADLHVAAALHPARAGQVWRSVLGPLARKQRKKTPPFATVTQHQKLATIDRDWLYIGGLDLNERRFDTQAHDRPSDETWTDVQLLLRGPEAIEAAEHLESFVAQTHGAPPLREMQYLRRTLSRPRDLQTFHLSPKTVLSEIETAHLAGIRDAQHLIYIETQFLRSSRIARALARAAMEKPLLRLILVLPAMPDDVAFEHNRDLDARYGLWLSHQALKRVKEAFGPRLSILSPVRPRTAPGEGLNTLADAPIIYVHSKVFIADDRFALVGSANLNGRSLRWDTEAAVAVRDPARVDMLRSAICAHWWRGAAPAEALDLHAAQGWWRDAAQDNLRTAPSQRYGFLVPHDRDRAPDLRVPLPGITEDIV